MFNVEKDAQSKGRLNTSNYESLRTEYGIDLDWSINALKISMFSNCKSNTPKDAPLIQVLLAIIEGKRYSDQILILRQMVSSNKKGAQFFKSSALPAFTPSGLFQGGRTKEHLIKYTSIIVLDIDDLEPDKLEITFNQITEIPFTLCAFRSPSGNGIKVFVTSDCKDPAHHGLIFQQVANHYSSLLGVKIDPCGRDITRLCIVSSDPKGYFMKTAQLFNLDKQSINNDALRFNREYSKAMRWTNTKSRFEKGNRNNFIFRLACNCKDLDLDRNAVESRIQEDFLSKYDYDEAGIRASIKSAYKDQVSGTKKNVAEVVTVAQHNKHSFKSFEVLAEEGKTLKPKGKLFGDYILERSTVIFPSERGVGKSLLVMQLAIVIAKGVRSFLEEDINLHGNVIYINLELNEETVSRRLFQLNSMYKDRASSYEPYCLTSRSGLMPLIDQIREYCSHKKPVLLIIDNLRTAFTGADNEKNSVMTQAMGIINQLKDEIGASLLIVHHLKKGTSMKLTDSDMQSGAGALSDLVDADFFLRKTGSDKNRRLLLRKKSRDAREQDGAKLITLNPDTLWFEFVEDNVNEAEYIYAEASSKSTNELKFEATALKEAGLSYAEIGRKLDKDRSTVKRWFD